MPSNTVSTILSGAPELDKYIATPSFPEFLINLLLFIVTCGVLMIDTAPPTGAELFSNVTFVTRTTALSGMDNAPPLLSALFP